MRNKDMCPNHAPYIVDRLTQLNKIKALVHSSQKPTSKLAARTFIQSQYLKASTRCELASWLRDE